MTRSSFHATTSVCTSYSEIGLQVCFATRQKPFSGGTVQPGGRVATQFGHEQKFTGDCFEASDTSSYPSAGSLPSFDVARGPLVLAVS